MSQRRRNINRKDRQAVYAKTNGYCHICGGRLDESWKVDHVIPFSAGGDSLVGNYLPACGVCNRLRWFYTSREIRKILRLGIYAQAEIRHKTALGQKLTQVFTQRTALNRKRRLKS